MAVISADDEQLRHLVYAHDCAIVKYSSPTCSVCQELAPVYEQLSEEEKYEGILFLNIDAEQNQIAKQFLAERATPLVVTYHNGIVLDAETAYSAEDMGRILNKLVTHRRPKEQQK